MKEDYKANEYYRQAQRFIYPLYKREELGGYCFSSTATFATYNKKYFCIFAAHALDINESTLDNIGFLAIDGTFISLSESCKSHKIYQDHDIVICVSEQPFEPRNHFNLSQQKSETEFNTDSFGWIGFPQKKAIQVIHRSKASPDKIANHLSVADDGRLKWNHAKFLIIEAKIDFISDLLISGKFENKDVNYEYEGFRQQGYSPRGMSGGALFHGPKKLGADPKSLDDIFLFAGIGLEYDGSSIKGVPKDLIVSLIEKSIEP
ncbi:hypothetical protein [Achromobacter insuavis]|uniref:hypothetical protein n=1 Tax=Achromobacter insuavis TaxID=1287735 RepID=UPI001F13AC80|nr:hypothetical protein [Achromobacter insuavis]